MATNTLLGLALAAAFPFPPLPDRFGDPLPAGAVARLGFVRTGTSSPLNIADGPLAAFAPDGRLFATACHNRVYVWDVTAGRVRWRSVVGDDHVGRLVFTGDGRELIAQTRAGRFRRWRVDSGREVRGEVDGTAAWGAARLSPGGRWMVSAQGDVWDLTAGAKVAGGRLPINRNQAGVAISADERWLFIASTERKAGKDVSALEQWDLAANKRQRAFDGFPGGSIAVSPDGRTVASVVTTPDPKVANKFTYAIALYDTAAGRERLRLPEATTQFGQPVFSPDGKRFAAVTARGVLHLWDAETGKELRTWAYDRDYLGWLAFSPDGKRIGLCGHMGTAVLWDVATGRPRSLNEETPYYVTDLLFSGDGKRLAAGYSDGHLRLWDVATQEVRHTARHGGTPSQSAITDLGWVGPAGPLIYRSQETPPGEVRLFDPTTGRDGPLSLGDGVEVQAVLSARRTLIVGARPPARHDFRWQPLAPDKLEATRRAAQARPEFRGFRVLTPAPVREEVPARAGPPIWMDSQVASHVAAVSPDGTHVVEVMMKLPGAAFATGAGPHWSPSGLRLVDVETGRVVREFPRPYSGLAVVPDVRSVVFWKAADRADAVDLVETSTGQTRWRAILPRAVGGVAVSPSGRWLAVNEQDGDRLYLLDAATGAVVVEHRAGRLYSGTSRLAFSPDGRLVARAEPDGTVLLWRVPAAPARPTAELTAGILADAWRDLASADAAAGFRALVRLADAPVASLPLLRQELLREDDRERINRWIARLDSPEFADREKATRELAGLGAVARPFLARALRPGVSLEARTRLEKLLAAQADPFATAAGLRQLRAVEALERIGSADARRVLERLADGSPDDDPLGREAWLSAERLKR